MVRSVLLVRLVSPDFAMTSLQGMTLSLEISTGIGDAVAEEEGEGVVVFEGVETMLSCILELANISINA